jgi:hypothetical protein
MGRHLSKPSGACDETKPVELVPLVLSNKSFKGTYTYDYKVKQVPKL